MNKHLPLLDSCELEDEPALELTRDKPIGTAEQRLQSWALVAIGGSTNIVRVDGVSYSWDAHPARLKNGAMQGRVYAQRPGELARDIGGFKIDARGRVERLPAPLRRVLPGGLEAAIADDSEESAS